MPNKELKALKLNVYLDCLNIIEISSINWFAIVTRQVDPREVMHCRNPINFLHLLVAVGGTRQCIGDPHLQSLLVILSNLTSQEQRVVC